MSNEHMKAVVYRKVGGPEVLEMITLPKPTPECGEVRIRIKASALNFLDYALRIEDDPDVPMPHILGSDISGDIDMLGEGVKDWREGEPILVSPTTSCGNCYRCRNGEDSLCDLRGILGYQTQGGYAEYIVVPARNLVKKPSILSYEEAASLPLVSATAYRMIYRQGRLRAGEKVLVMGGSSGIGSMAIQLCKAAGAWVVTTVGTEWKVDLAKELGADHVILHKGIDWPKQVLDLTNGYGVDLACDHLGGHFLASCIDLLANGGRLVTIGSTVGSEIKIDNFKLYRKQASIIGSYMGSIVDLRDVLKLVECNLVRPVVYKVFPLEEAVNAHRYMEERNYFGKIVLTVR